MAKKLTEITTSYSKFAEQQILTHEQLNKFLDYFDEQDRLSRICLSGVGIACGFEVSVGRRNAITIAQGAGVTTDGDLIHLVGKREPEDSKEKVDRSTLEDILVDKIKYEYYRDYEPTKVEYHPFFNKNDKSKDYEQITLHEIVPREVMSTKTDTSLQSLDLRNKVILFYLECYPKQPDNCLKVDCESQGIEQVNNLRVLLVDNEDVDRVVRTDSLFNSYTTLESYLETKTVYVPRVILNESNTSTASNLAAEYQDTPLINSAITNIRFGMKTILSRMDRGTDALRFEDDLKRIFPTNEDTNLILFQYKYDLLKDLADSYNELKELFLLNYATCCPDISAFPKHLLLGKFYASRDNSFGFVSTPISGSTIRPDLIDGPQINLGSDDFLGRIAAPTSYAIDYTSYRHKFHKSPILLDNDEGNGRFESVLARILTMVSEAGFYDSSEFDTEIIRITPSNVRVPLGKRAVPFYYQFNNSLMLNWDYDKREYNRHRSILGYRQASAYSLFPNVANPLQFSIDPYDFFRIEGHQGNPYDQVFESLKILKDTYSLPFDIKVLGINVTEFDELLAEQYKCDFKDLGVLLKAWSEEQICIAEEVADLLSSFSTQVPGANTKVNSYFDLTRNTAVSKIGDLTKAEGPSFGLSDDLASSTKSRSFATFEPFEFEATPYSDANDSVPVNPILDRINPEPDTVGYYVNKAITDASGNYGNAVAFALNDLEAIVSEWDRKVAESTVIVPTKVTLACTSLIDFLPTKISQLSDSTLSSYNTQIDVLCGYTKKLQSLYYQTDEESAEVSPTAEKRISVIDKDTRSMISLLINQLTSICCSSKKLQALLEEVMKRKSSIIERLNFKNFAEKNPGLEHKAGAGPGQTFVIVYINEAVTESTGFTNINVIPGLSGGFTSIGSLGSGPLISALTTSPGITDASIGSSPLSTSPIKPQSITDKTTSSGTLSSSIGGLSSNLRAENRFLIDPSILNPSRGEKVIIPKGAVIADFTLPYMCCSDCAPISFVLPNIPVSLTLSGNTYCLDDSNQEIDLTVSPTDGVVTVVDSVPGVNIVGTSLTIDGSIFPPELYGTKIKFKVDGEETNAELMVSKKPNVDFTIPDVGSNRLVQFSVTGFNSPEFIYNWSFGDGNTSTEREPEHDYSDAGVTKNFIVTLTVETTAGICPTVVSHPLNFIDVDISVDGAVCEDGDPLPFTIIPEGASVDIEGQGLNPEKTHFDPTIVGPGSYPMSSNGVVFQTIIVKPKPNFDLDIAVHKNNEKEKLEFSVETVGALAYQWKALLPDGKQTTSILETFSIGLDVIEKYNPGDEFKISVTVTYECGKVVAQDSWFIPEVNAPKATLERLRFCIDDPTAYEFDIEHFASDTIITGPGVDGNASPPTFTPSNATVGTHSIVVDDVTTDTVIVVAPPVILIQSISLTESGFAFVGSIPAELDASNLEWSFTDKESGDVLHSVVSGTDSDEVLFSNFLSTDWTDVTVTLTATVEPCLPVSVSEDFPRPIDVQVGMETLDYCKDDPGPHPFTFIPDDGSVSFEVVTGISADGRSLIPEELDPGPHTFTASNGDSVTVTIHARPTIPAPTIVLNAAEDGIDVSISPVPQGIQGSTVTWTYEDSTLGGEIHPPVSGPNGNVQFENFTSQSWETVKVTITADFIPCTGVSSFKTFDKPEEVVVVVSLETLTYCKGDTRDIPFIFTPNTPVSITGPEPADGLNAEGTGFFPNQLPLGPSTFTAESGQQITVEIIEPVYATLNDFDFVEATKILNLSYTPLVAEPMDVSWTIGNEKLGQLDQSDQNPWAVDIGSLNLTPGTVLNYDLTLTNSICGEQGYSGTFTVPTILTDCVADMVRDLTALNDGKPTINNIIKQFGSTKTEKIDEVTKFYGLLADLIANPSNVINGSMNDRIATELHDFIDFLAEEIGLALEANRPEFVTRLSILYSMAVEIYEITFRCQNKVNFEQFSLGGLLNAKLRRHFDSKEQVSLVRNDLSVINVATRSRIEAVLSNKDKSDEPWATIDFVIQAGVKN